MMVPDLMEAEASIEDLKILLKWYPANKRPLCGTLYTALCPAILPSVRAWATQVSTR